MDDDLTLDAAMQEIYREFGTTQIEPDEFTEMMYSHKFGIPIQSVGRQLQAAVAAGRVTRRRAISNGRRCWAYKIARNVPGDSAS